MTNDNAGYLRIWDPFVRIGHWLLVAGFAIAYLVTDEPLGVHVWAGYTVGGVVVWRLVWGFVGPRYARFADFIYRPNTVLAYIADLLRLRARRYLGHSPAGGAMIFGLLVMLGVTVYSGLAVYALENNRGPLAGVFAVASVTAGAALADETRETEEDNDEAANGAANGANDEGAEGADDPASEARREFWKDLHEWVSEATLILILLHIGGVALASFAHRENLVAAMITGRKRRDPD